MLTHALQAFINAVKAVIAQFLRDYLFCAKSWSQEVGESAIASAREQCIAFSPLAAPFELTTIKASFPNDESLRPAGYKGHVASLSKLVYKFTKCAYDKVELLTKCEALSSYCIRTLSESWTQ